MDKAVLQVAFNKAYLGVIAQGGASSPAIVPGCFYRHDGKKCGVGHIIPDDHYDLMFDNAGEQRLGCDTDIESLLRCTDTSAGITAALIAGGIPEPVEYIPFLQDLQDIHDTNVTSEVYIETFRKQMKGLARKHELEVPGEGAQP